MSFLFFVLLMKEARLEAKVTDLCLEQVQISATLPPSPQKGILT